MTRLPWVLIGVVIGIGIGIVIQPPYILHNPHDNGTVRSASLIRLNRWNGSMDFWRRNSSGMWYCSTDFFEGVGTPVAKTQVEDEFFARVGTPVSPEDVFDQVAKEQNAAKPSASSAPGWLSTFFTAYLHEFILIVGASIGIVLLRYISIWWRRRKHCRAQKAKGQENRYIPLAKRDPNED